MKFTDSTSTQIFKKKSDNSCQKKKIKKKKPKHPKGWNNHLHYMKMGGQCGQSCPCCRLSFSKSRDPDGHWGACPICLG